jgi:hypothetical protein
MIDTQPICGFNLMTLGEFSTQDFTTICNGGQLFILVKPVYYLSKDGRLFQMPVGAQSDGISAPRAVQNLRPCGGNDWAAGWLHDCCYRFSLQVWDGTQWVKWDASQGRTKAASDDFLYECAIVCGDNQAEADTLYWAVTEFGKRDYQAGA